MKRYKHPIGTYAAALLLALMLNLGWAMPKAQAQYGNEIGYQDFYDDLAPYGQWFNDPQYGYVWTPNNVGRDFRPYYTNGYWSMTDYGNMWMSNYAWGWAPFHYGRWALTNYGWVWIPGSEWGPAWVTWRQGGGYYGWAPMGPGISINVSFGNGYYAPDPWWTFIPCGQIYNNRFHRYHNPRRNNTYIHNTTIINNTYYDNRSRNTYVTGPRRNDVERATGRKVNVYQVNNRSRAGRTEQSGRTVSVYRPNVRANSKAVKQAAPRAVKQVDATRNNKQTAVRQQTERKAQSPVNRSVDSKRSNNNKAVNQQDSRQRAAAVKQEQQTRQQEVQRQQRAANEQNSRQRAVQQERAQQQRQQVQRQQQADRQEAAQRQRASQQRQQRQPQAERPATQRQQVQQSQPQRKESVAPSRSSQRNDGGSRSSSGSSNRERSGSRGGR